MGGGGVTLQLLKLQLPLRLSYLHLNLYFHSSHHLRSRYQISCDDLSALTTGVKLRVLTLYFTLVAQNSHLTLKPEVNGAVIFFSLTSYLQEWVKGLIPLLHNLKLYNASILTQLLKL